MIQTATDNLTEYYATVQSMGKILTPEQARLWSRSVLNLMGINMSRSAKSALAKALPEALGSELKRVFWLLHFRNTNVTLAEFQENVARRSGHMDKNFAKVPITAVFHALKQLIPNDVSSKVADDLSPELRKLWQHA
ncbi:MAG: DUF2267 domain-containing protein [Anaerolineales bacterium]|nr:DUF2267 domain-containing protein [Anaerolineales bacterium]MCA9928308.1 DUF2267 domain-containing protein [Anaerolineales bacterium]